MSEVQILSSRWNLHLADVWLTKHSHSWKWIYNEATVRGQLVIQKWGFQRCSCVLISGVGGGGRQPHRNYCKREQQIYMYMASIFTKGPWHTSLQSMVKLAEISCLQMHFLKTINQIFSENLRMHLPCSADWLGYASAKNCKILQTVNESFPLF